MQARLIALVSNSCQLSLELQKVGSAAFHAVEPVPRSQSKGSAGV